MFFLRSLRIVDTGCKNKNPASAKLESLFVSRKIYFFTCLTPQKLWSKTPSVLVVSVIAIMEEYYV